MKRRRKDPTERSDTNSRRKEDHDPCSTIASDRRRAPYTPVDVIERMEGELKLFFSKISTGNLVGTFVVADSLIKGSSINVSNNDCIQESRESFPEVGDACIC